MSITFNFRTYFIIYLKMDEMTYSYDGRFDGNILVVGRTGCGKTTFVQNLAKDQLFGDIKKVFWIMILEIVFKIKMFILTIQTM